MNGQVGDFTRGTPTITTITNSTITLTKPQPTISTNILFPRMTTNLTDNGPALNLLAFAHEAGVPIEGPPTALPDFQDTELTETQDDANDTQLTEPDQHSTAP